MSASTNPHFNLVVPITGYTIRKSADGTEKYVLTGMASNTNIDLHGERMAKSAIIAMEKSLENGPVTINNEHSKDWDADFGEVTRFWSTDSYELMMEAELDPDHYRTKTLIKALNKGKKLGLSIGGAVKTAAREYVEEIGRTVLTFKDVALFHVAIVGSPAVAETWVAPITKSMKDWKEPSMPSNTKNDENVEEVAETGSETPVESETRVIDAPTDPRPEEALAEDAKTPVVEQEDVVTDEPTDAHPAEDHVSEATDTDTPAPSDTEEAQQPTEVTTDSEPETPPAEPEAPAQEDESPASEESAPDPADEGTSEVVKSAEPIFGGYANANVAEVSVRALTEEFSWAVWSAVYTGEGDERSADERKDYVARALGEYSAIVQSVANALIDNGTTAEAEKSFVVPRAEDVTKSIAERDTKVEELTKSLESTQEKASSLQKSLDDKSKELETVQEELTKRSGDLETATGALEETQKSLETALNKIAVFEGRKSFVIDKFAGTDQAKVTDAEEATIQAQQKFASFITSGPLGS